MDIIYHHHLRQQIEKSIFLISYANSISYYDKFLFNISAITSRFLPLLILFTYATQPSSTLQKASSVSAPSKPTAATNISSAIRKRLGHCPLDLRLYKVQQKLRKLHHFMALA
jgi:hypothetical protein